jgi:hypothetical protein
MGPQTFYDIGPHPLLRADSQATIGSPNRQNYCVIFILYTQFTNAAAGRIIKSGGPRVVNQRCKL